jgi:hypothetical protein
MRTHEPDRRDLAERLEARLYEERDAYKLRAPGCVDGVEHALGEGRDGTGSVGRYFKVSSSDVFKEWDGRFGGPGRLGTSEVVLNLLDSDVAH